jgi:hypothetical protein
VDDILLQERNADLGKTLLEKFLTKYGSEFEGEGLVEHGGRAYWVKHSGTYREALD